MAKYFRNFPKTFYIKDSSSNLDFVTNITSRFSFEKEFRENTAVFYKYEIQDSDTPEIIASKVYGSPERHWIILMMNEKLDPQFDWPLSNRTLNRYIEKKYISNASPGQTGLFWAQNNNHSYYKIEKRTTLSTNTSIETKVQISASEYANLTSTSTNTTLNDGSVIQVDILRNVLTYYQYELELNEEKRTINILKPEFVTAVEEELGKVFKE
jgi:hypothetical protein